MNSHIEKSHIRLKCFEQQKNKISTNDINGIAHIIPYYMRLCGAVAVSFSLSSLCETHKFCGPPYVYDQYNSFNGDHCNNVVVYDNVCVHVCGYMDVNVPITHMESNGKHGKMPVSIDGD